MRKIYCLSAVLVLLLFLPACANEPQPSGSGEEKGAAMEVSQGRTAAADVEKQTSSPVKGKVVETMDAGPYTYIQLDIGSDMRLWAAIPKKDLEIGEEITLHGGDMVVENFNSSTLNRTFDIIIFATGVSSDSDQEFDDGEAAGDYGDDAVLDTIPASGGSAGNVVPFAGVIVEKAPGVDGHRVVEIFEKASILDKKNVVVRGQVVKFSKNIMGKNWIHIQDGTGDPEKNTHDLVVTTTDTVEIGDIVTVEGQAAAAIDFGYGYEYDVIVENAKISKVENAKNMAI